MKDPYSGPGAVTTLIVVLIVKFSALDAIVAEGNWTALMAAPLLGRAALPLLFLTTPYVRPDGLGSVLASHLPRRSAIVILFATVLVILFVLGHRGFWLLLVSTILFFAVRRMMMHRIDGTTGDTAGSLVELLELVSLLTIALTVPFIAFAADGYNLNSVYVGGGGKSQIQETDGKTKTSGKAFFGREFNKAFSLEAGYVDLGKHDTGTSNTVRERGPFIEALVHFAVSESFSPFLKGGVHRLEVATHTSTSDSKENNADPALGAGINFNIGKHMGARFEWGRFKSKNHDTDLVSANIVHYYR